MTPSIDLARQSVGPLRLGDPPDAAASLGKPARVHGCAGNEVLEFDEFELEFSEGRLVCAKFDIDEGSGVSVGDYRLTRATKPLDVQVWFGDPASDSKGGGSLRWIDFERDGATLALEFDAKGLSCVQLYAAGYA